MSRVAAPADKRFRRAYVKPTRKRGWEALAWRAGKYALVVLIGGAAMFRAVEAVVHSSMLDVRQIAVRGNHWFTTGEVHALLGELYGENLVWADLPVWRERLLTSPWVKDASLRRSLPSTVEITIAERLPISLGRIQGRLYLMDDRGIVIDEYGPKYAQFDLPIVDGLDRDPAAGPSAADAERAALAARLITAVAADKAVAERLSQVNVGNVRNAWVMLTGDPAVIYVGTDRFLPRLQSYVQLSTAIREMVPDVNYVDLRFDDHIYVGPSGMKRTVPAAAIR